LCALYNRSFITELPDDERTAPQPEEKNPLVFGKKGERKLVSKDFDWSPEGTVRK